MGTALNLDDVDSILDDISYGPILCGKNPLSVLKKNEFIDWLETSRYNDKIIYFSGASLRETRNGVIIQSITWNAYCRGFVSLFQKRRIYNNIIVFDRLAIRTKTVYVDGIYMKTTLQD
jgi:hypothetical protein